MLTKNWKKPSRSGNNGQCVEVRLVDDVVEVRNSNDPSGPFVSYTRGEWEMFIDSADEFKIQ